MIFVFTYIDEIAGKGIDSGTLAQLFMYTFLMFIPNSMPLAILLSSIMTLGNFGETYELAAMKSSGLSLLRIMRPLLIFIICLSAFCFAFSNYTLPYIHLKQASILYDVREAKPTLNIKESVFYNGIEGYSIRVGKKDKDGKTIHDILIYDHTEKRGNIVQLYADSGRLETSENKNALVMTLFNGNRYQQILNDNNDVRRRPMISASFEKQKVHFDLSNFQLKRTDEELFRNNAEMMNINQLNGYIDSTKLEKKKVSNDVQYNFNNYYYKRVLQSSHKCDSLKVKSETIKNYFTRQSAITKNQILDNALNQTNTSVQFLEGKVGNIENSENDKAKYLVNWHKKFTLSFACIVLFFVGAPLGAIVRKGGLGMPVVISVILFIVYHVISFICEKMALEGELNPLIAMWAGPMLFLPFGIWLSLKAAKDSALFDSTVYYTFFKKIFRRKKQKPEQSQVN